MTPALALKAVTPPFTAEALRLDAEAAVAQITDSLRRQVRGRLRKRGLVLGLSGGVDSSLCAALAAHAFGPGRVLGLMMPEHDSDDDSLTLAQAVADAFRIPWLIEDIGPMLDAMGCYARRDAAIRSVVPEYGAGWTSKVVIADPLAGAEYGISSLVVRAPDGATHRLRLRAEAYQALIAATNMKQRTRKLIEYTHADRLNYAVVGTPNRLEYDQGFFVRNGDGAADVKPIAHLYKTQVYQLARHLGVPDAVLQRPPTTDTWSLPQTQEEFYFALPWPTMDLCLAGLAAGAPPHEIAACTGLTEAQVAQVARDIAAKRRATAPLHLPPLLVGD
ncbi:NAD(+) synthetase [Methylobacterium sp. Leaf456]|uniref:NAD(+) synthase n=1 Tax=Methylobacterium sp. Leaf456 TaxID=1736382 RepID=UPI0006F76F64|nr:NAD(+) synthase [Methylobacterium sp. Leaf456]KQT59907.1 NAD(+) synthetase [Methylobacterium sp. Leaf456]